LKKLRESHLLWLIIGDHKSHYLGFPVKGYEYIGAKRPLLVFSPLPSEAQNIITELNCGKVLSSEMDDKTTHENSKHLLEYFQQFYNKELNDTIDIDDTRLKKYTREYHSELFANIFDKVLNLPNIENNVIKDQKEPSTY